MSYRWKLKPIKIKSKCIINMPKVILEFDSFEDSEELKVALDGGKWKNVVW